MKAIIIFAVCVIIICCICAFKNWFTEKKQKYAEFYSEDAVMMEYETIKKLYAVNPSRWGYNKNIHIRFGNGWYWNDRRDISGLIYNISDEWDFEKTWNKEEEKRPYIRVTLSFADWLKFEKDRTQYNERIKKEREQERQKQLTKKQMEDLDQILSVAKIDIENAISDSEKQIRSGIDGIKKAIS